MSCCTFAKRSGRSSTSSRPSSDVEAPKGAIEVLGTWDFKWPQNTKIRVAFQSPDSPDIDVNDFKKAVEQIKKLARSWTQTNGKNHAAIDFDFLETPLEPADSTDPQNGSPFEAPNDLGAYGKVNYDVLVSLDQLPRGRRDPVSVELIERIFLPRSELGSFARRQDYGVPTINIGPFAGLFDKGLANYYEFNPVGRFYVVHEFGHVLGLIHEHQNPNRRQHLAASYKEATATAAIGSVNALNALSEEVDGLERQLESQRQRPLENQAARLSGVEKDLAQARKNLKEGLSPIKARVKDFLAARRIPLSTDESTLEQFILRQLVNVWPGNSEYSDLREWAKAEEPSVMDAPYYKCFLGLHAPKPNGECEECNGVFDAVLKNGPFPGDIEHLKSMYPLR